jgi:hypothetical protein
MLVWLDCPLRSRNNGTSELPPGFINGLISAELPDITVDPLAYACAGLLPINHQRIHGPTGDLTITPVYAGTKKSVVRRHKLANSLTHLLGHKRAIERALLE